jgi:hypothetical protein
MPGLVKNDSNLVAVTPLGRKLVIIRTVCMSVRYYRIPFTLVQQAS